MLGKGQALCQRAEGGQVQRVLAAAPRLQAQRRLEGGQARLRPGGMAPGEVIGRGIEVIGANVSATGLLAGV